MRKKIIAGNWKMNLNYSEAKQLLQKLIQQKDQFNPNAEIVICPPQLYLSVFAELLNDHQTIKLGAQNCYFHDAGAYTGEISPSQLKSLNIQHCIIGHSERRDNFNEDYDLLAKKAKALLRHHIRPIFCCGEQHEVRSNNVYKEFIMKQIEDSLFSLKPEEIVNVIIAYEPIWAIGTGKTATAAQAQEVQGLIRARVAKTFGDKVAAEILLIYGGSCKEDNAKELFAQPDIDGGLLGGASLNADEFIKISNSF
jgi:triosephosphate isomerase (TIM)